jgi:DNA mismatch repair protein MutS2
VRPHDLDLLEFPRVLEAIAALARSAVGRQAVLRLGPDPDREQRLDLVGETLALLPEGGRPPTVDLPQLEPILLAAAPEGAVLEPRRLAEIRDLLAAASVVRSWLDRDSDRFPRLAALAAAMPDPAEVSGALAWALDDTGQVRDEASPALAAARKVMRELRTAMEARLERLLRDPQMSEVIAESYVTVRNGRFVVPVRAQAVNVVSGVVQDRSQTGETVFLEPLFAVELNNRLLLAHKDEEGEERRVRAELTALVRAHTEALATVETALATVDAIGAAAAFTERHGCTRPVLGADEISLVAARHPLLLAAGRPVVPVDLHVPRDRRGLAITGPNAGGKTVALKTLGLSAVMAHAGLFIPAAEGSRLPLLDAVLVDIGDEQSIDRDLSTFSAHVESLAAIAATAGPRTLVLLDEPGAGTDPVEGSALAVGLLTHLLGRGPVVVFTSHFPQVKTFALATPELDVAAFDVDPASGAPRFALTYHSVGQSLALPIARRHGFPAEAIDIAERLLAGESRDLARAVARLEESRRAYEAERASVAAEGARLAAARAETDALNAELRAHQRRRWTEDLEESRRFVRDLRAEGRAVLEALRRKPEPTALAQFVRDAEERVAAHAAAMAPAEAPNRPPVLGDTVEVVGRGIRGELVEVAGDRARIQRGGLRFEVPADQLRIVAPEARKERIAVAVERPVEEEAELVLVGRRVRDAVDALTAFLDRAMRSGLSEVRIVHGIGGGALRRAVQECLAATPYCAGWREAEPSAGGAGVTIAELS